MCDAAVRKDPFSLQDVPDQFVTQRQIKTQRGDDDYGNYDDGVITWYDGYKKGTAQKAQIKEKFFHLRGSLQECETGGWKKTKKKDYRNVCLGR